MNKAEIKEALSQGKKVTHKLFLFTKYIKICPKSGTHYLTADENVLGIATFWKYRTTEEWDKDWSIFS